ncbi:MAG: DUF3754 domain-containing protein, partial [Thiomargarita sp.]|nr:DUF3754 domain-containing protein [Thiomargarita sp.]
LAAPHWNPTEKKQFGDFCTIFGALYHYKFHSDLEELKRCYTPFNPDSDMVIAQNSSDEEKETLTHTLDTGVRQLLNNANYEELTIDDINTAMSAESYYGLNVSVDLNDFEKLVVYFRGSSTKIEYRRTWYTLFLFKKPLETAIYKRLFLLLKLKSKEQRVKELVEIHGRDFEKKANKLVDNSRKHLPEEISDQHIFLKLFKDLPQTDLEMLFPNLEVRLKLLDKIKLGITGGGGTIFGIFSVVGKIALAATNPFAIIGALAGLGGIIFRQIMGIFTQRTKYMMNLSRNLYFHNLDNNFGVMSYLIDMAEEEEGKEAILAYYFLYRYPEKNYTLDTLDRDIEQYIQDKYDLSIDFEVEDGIRKLHDEHLLIEEEEGVLKVISLHDAEICLDEKWDAFFDFHSEK